MFEKSQLLTIHSALPLIRTCVSPDSAVLRTLDSALKYATLVQYHKRLRRYSGLSRAGTVLPFLIEKWPNCTCTFFHLICLKRLIWFLVGRTLIVYFWINNIKVKVGPIIHMLSYSPTKTQKLLGNPDKSANPTASSPACAGLAGEHCNKIKTKKKNICGVSIKRTISVHYLQRLCYFF